MNVLNAFLVHARKLLWDALKASVHSHQITFSPQLTLEHIYQAVGHNLDDIALPNQLLWIFPPIILKLRFFAFLKPTSLGIFDSELDVLSLPH